MLQLVVNTEEATSASIPIRWCVSRDTLALMQAKGALNPHLLLVVANGNREEARRLVPIDQMMEYVDFSSPGAHKIFGTIVWSAYGNARVLKKRILGGRVIDEDGYVQKFNKLSVLDDEGVLEVEDRLYKSDHEFAICSLDEASEIEVNVAKEFFAPPRRSSSSSGSTSGSSARRATSASSVGVGCSPTPSSRRSCSST